MPSALPAHACLESCGTGLHCAGRPVAFQPGQQPCCLLTHPERGSALQQHHITLA